MPEVDVLRNLEAKYAAMDRLDGMSPQVRGQQFNGLIAELLQAYGVSARPNQRSAGEIDVVFAVGETRYILEAKWTSAKADTGHLAKLQKRVRQRLAGTYGVFVSMAGFTTEALSDLMQGERLELILLDRGHIEALLRGEISPQLLLGYLRDRASFMGQPYTSMDLVRTEALASGTKPRLPDDGLPPAHPLSSPESGSPWNPEQAIRGNPVGYYTTFNGHQGLYWVVIGLFSLIALLTSFGILDGHGLWKLLFAGILTFEVLLIIGVWRMAMRPIRLEVGALGIQTFFPRTAAWMPWEYIDRVDIIRVDGNLTVVAWSRYAHLFPTSGEAGLNAFYLPKWGAVALCPVGHLRAKRHVIARALHAYGQGRF